MGLGKSKSQLQVNLSRNVKGNVKGFSKCMDDKRKTKEYVGQLPNETRDLVTEDVE